MNENQTIRVVRHTGNYVVLDKGFLVNPELSFKAKGILAYLLSKPDGWKVIVRDLVAHSKEGKAAIYAGLKELSLHGHYKNVPVRDESGRRISHWEGVISEMPMSKDGEALHAENREVDKPINVEATAIAPEKPADTPLCLLSDFQEVGNQKLENQPPNNNYINNNNLNNTLSQSDQGVTDEGANQVYEYLKTVAGKEISRSQIVEVSRFILQGVSPAMIREVINIAVPKAKNIWAYTKKALDNHIANGILTLADLQAHEARRALTNRPPPDKRVTRFANFEQRSNTYDQLEVFERAYLEGLLSNDN